MTATDNLLASRSFYADQCSALRQENERLRAELAQNKLSYSDRDVIDEALRNLMSIYPARQKDIGKTLNRLYA